MGSCDAMCSDVSWVECMSQCTIGLIQIRESAKLPAVRTVLNGAS